MTRCLSALVAAAGCLSPTAVAHDGVLQPTLQLIVAAGNGNQVAITERDGYCHIVANGIPDHESGQFPNRNNPNRISEQRYRFRMTLTPAMSRETTSVGMNLFGVALNGVPFDPSAAEFWQRNPRSGWQYEAMGGGVNLGLDSSHAHVQPTGAYHYHGLPTQLVRKLARGSAMVMIGYAADGFPVYTLLGHEQPNDTSTPLRKLRSSYQIRTGFRPGGRSGPGGRFDGAFVEDYEYVEGSGDLDECNGRLGVTSEYPSGTYYYVLTEKYPFIPRVYRGEPDERFVRRRPGPGARGCFGRGPGFRPPPPPRRRPPPPPTS